MKSLLTVTGLIEFFTGLMLMSIPSSLTQVLFGSSLDTSLGLTIARAAGVAITSLGMACWLTRTAGQTIPAKGLVAAMAVYNIGIMAVFGYAGLVFNLHAIGLWPVVLVHFVMAIWCVLILLKRPA